MWFTDVHADGDWFACGAQVRAHGEAVAVRARSLPDGGIEVDVTAGAAHRLQGVAAGQSLVLYGDSQVLAQATVDATTPAVRA